MRLTERDQKIYKNRHKAHKYSHRHAPSARNSKVDTSSLGYKCSKISQVPTDKIAISFLIPSFFDFTPTPYSDQHGTDTELSAYLRLHQKGVLADQPSFALPLQARGGGSIRPITHGFGSDCSSVPAYCRRFTSLSSTTAADSGRCHRDSEYRSNGYHTGRERVFSACS